MEKALQKIKDSISNLFETIQESDGNLDFSEVREMLNDAFDVDTSYMDSVTKRQFDEFVKMEEYIVEEGAFSLVLGNSSARANSRVILANSIERFEVEIEKIENLDIRPDVKNLSEASLIMKKEIEEGKTRDEVIDPRRFPSLNFKDKAAILDIYIKSEYPDLEKIYVDTDKNKGDGKVTKVEKIDNSPETLLDHNITQRDKNCDFDRFQALVDKVNEYVEDDLTPEEITEIKQLSEQECYNGYHVNFTGKEAVVVEYRDDKRKASIPYESPERER